MKLETGLSSARSTNSPLLPATLKPLAITTVISNDAERAP